MKNIKELNINPEKLIKNDELLNLKGGDEGSGPCGTSHAYYCDYRPYPAPCPMTENALVCEGAYGNPEAAILATYPDATEISCNLVVELG